jgi:uncharacterized protein (DUF1330 family)
MWGRMTFKVIGLMELTDQNAFEEYRRQVGQTVELHKGLIYARGTITEIFWNELNCNPFSTYVELHFPSQEDAHTWVNSPQYQALVSVRSQAMKLTLFGVAL